MTSFLAIVVLLLIFLNTKAILRPAKYEEVYKERYELNSNRLTAIVELQKLYKKVHGSYAPSVDSLVDFYENGFITIRNTSYRTDSIPKDLTLAQIQNMSMEEREKRHLNVYTEQKLLVKDQMADILNTMNEKRDPEDKIVMNNFQYIPFSNNKKYDIVTRDCDRTDSTSIQRFAIYVDRDELLQNFDNSLYTEDQGAISRGFSKMLYKNLEFETRERMLCVGIQLGDTTSNSLEIKDYGVKVQ